MVKQFYDKLSINDGVLCLSVNGHHIRIIKEIFNNLFDLHPTNEHVRLYYAQGWPTMVNDEIIIVCAA